MGCGASLMRVILMIFNTLFLLAGLAGIGGGIWMAVSPNELFEFVKVTVEGDANFVRTAAYVFIGASCFVVLVAALGCFGACMRNRCALGCYAAFMLILLALQIAAIVLIAVYDQHFRNEAKDELTKKFIKAYKDTKNQFTKTMDDIQKNFKCCGVNGATDYNKNNVNVPASCGANLTTGCYDAIRDWVKKHLGIVIGITVAVIVFQIILFIFAICLCRHSDFEKVV